MRRTYHLPRALLVVSCLLQTGTACTNPPEPLTQRKAATQEAPAQYETKEVTVVLPAGNKAAGRQAFADLKCVVCHRVAGETTFPTPISDMKGPDLDRTLGQRPASEVASAIIVPSHSMSVKTSPEVKKRLEGMLVSPMGDFSRAMTIGQLADLLAYLTALEN
jgi:mono/diheme cytochrome c family protein